MCIRDSLSAAAALGGVRIDAFQRPRLIAACYKVPDLGPVSYTHLRLLNEERPYFSLKLVYEGDTLTQAVLDGKRIV